MMEFWFYTLLGFSLGLACTKWALMCFPAWGLLDFPERYGLKRPKLPYPGGIVLCVLSLVLWTINPDFWILVLPALILGWMSFVDDRTPLPSWFRLLVQLGLASFIYLMGISIDFVGNPFAGTNMEFGAAFPLLSFVLTVFWIVGIQNATNWFDGIKGLTLGVSAIGFLTLGILGLVRPELFFDLAHTPVTHASLYMAGLCMGAFGFYFKGRILLGDSGSQVLGFILAVLAIWSGAKIATTLLVLSLPLIDLILVVGRRVLVDGTSPFSGDLKHLPHNLSRKVGESRATLILMALSVAFGSIAVWMTGLEKFIALCLVGIGVLVLGVWVYRQS